MLVGVLSLGALAVVLTAGPRERASRRTAAPPRSGDTAAAQERERETEAGFADEALRFRRRQMADEHGRIAPLALMRAARQAGRLQGRLAAAPLVAGIERGTWTPLGPANIGGRTRALVISPAAPQTIWAGSASGGIWKSTDGGGSWRPLDDFMASLRVETLVIDPQHADVLYAGTGESDASVPFEGIRGAGIFRTTDGGVTWDQLPTTTSADFENVNRLAMAPGAPGTLLAATQTGIWRTTDGGATAWTLTRAGRTRDVDFHPTDVTQAIAGGQGAAYYSTDGGASWTAATGLPAGAARVEVAYAPSDPSKVYASVNSAQGRVYRSTDGGHSYAVTSSGTNYLGGQGDYSNSLWVDPTNPARIVVGGIDLWTSTAGGSGLTAVSDWRAQQDSGTSVHADNHVIVSDPRYDGTTNRRVYVGGDGGVYKTDDLPAVTTTSGWTPLNDHYGVTQFYSGAGNATTGRIIGGTQDNGTPSTVAGTDRWVSAFAGDGGQVASDPLHANVFYGEYAFLRIFRNDNGGASPAGSTYINGGDITANANGDCLKNAPYRLEDSCTKNANFVAPFVLDPSRPDRLYAGGASLWRTDDARAAMTSTTGPHWREIKPPVGSLISAVAVAPGNPDLVYVGYNDGRIHKSANATAASPAWTRVDQPGMPGRMTLSLTIDPHDAQTVYAGFGGFAADNLWRTTDGGAGWSPRVGTGAAALPAAPVRSIAIHPANSAFLYAGTEVGAFASADGGANWNAPQDGPANVSVDQLFWMGTKLVAATHGRGMFQTDVDAVRPPNDRFADAQPLTGIDVARTADTNVGATKEGSAEPDHAGNGGGASVWYRWTPTRNGPVVIDTIGSAHAGGTPLDTVLAAYHGPDLAHLTVDAANDDRAAGNPVSRITFAAVAGRTYVIAVDGHRGATGFADTGTVALHLAQTPAPDTTPPANPTALTSPSHTVGAWSGDATVDVAWSGATDDSGGSGVAGYAFAWDTAPSTASQDLHAVTTTTSPPLADGLHTFNLRTADNAGNLSPTTAQLGPFLIDTTPPDPGPVASTSHTPGVGSTSAVLEVGFASASDAGSGVDGYSVAVDTAPTTVPPAVRNADATARGVRTSPLAPGSYWFHLRVADAAGNWSAPLHLGPFEILAPALGAGPPGADGAGQPALSILTTQPSGTARPAPPTGATGQGGVRKTRCVVPGLARRTLAAARTALTRAHCAVGTIRRAPSRTVDRGRVIAQAPRAGTTLKAGGRVALTVSRGRPRR